MHLARALPLLGIVGCALASAIQRDQEHLPLGRETAKCSEDYTAYASKAHSPLSKGKYQLGYQRPPKHCRTFTSDKVEKKIKQMKHVIADPDLYRLFENSYPNTLDTTVKWKGKASGSDDELTFIITGDIDAMWVRDSSSQLHSYLPFLQNKHDEFASLYRGLINIHSRYITKFPYCNAFQPPMESGLDPVNNSDAFAHTTVFPEPDNSTVFECKYELDSIASFFQTASEYYKVTKDIKFFSDNSSWLKAVKVAMSLIEEQTYPTYSKNGSVVIAPYTFEALTMRATETLSNNAYGNPVQGGTGLIRSTFRPSDDACIYQLFVPANMMLASKLEDILPLMKALRQNEIARQMQEHVKGIRRGIDEHATSKYGFAFEVDGFGSVNSMDDAGVPSLLSIPYLGYADRDDPTYQRTRRKVLSVNNPYWMRGPALSAIGSPHIGPGWSWPMATIMQILTSDDDEEIKSCLEQLLSSTDGLGLCHESIFASDPSTYTRPWFAWVNGLFGEMILDLEERKPHILKTSFQ